MYLSQDPFQEGGSGYVQAANGYLRGQLLLGSSCPLHHIARSIYDALKLGLNDYVWP